MMCFGSKDYNFASRANILQLLRGLLEYNTSLYVYMNSYEYLYSIIIVIPSLPQRKVNQKVIPGI